MNAYDLQTEPSHFFGEIRIFHGGQAKTPVAVGQPEVPQTGRFGLGFQTFEDFGLTLSILPPVALVDFGLVFLLKRHDFVADHICHAVQKIAVFLAQPERHIHQILSSASGTGLYLGFENDLAAVTMSSQVTGRKLQSKRNRGK